MRDAKAPATRGVGYHQSVKVAKRRAALDAAFEVFCESGFADATLQQIAARGGVSTATLFKHFPTKAKLFEAMVMEAWDFDDRIIHATAHVDLLDDLLRIGRTFADRLGHEQTISLYRVLFAALHLSPELGRVMLERGKLSYVRQLSAFLESRVPFQAMSDHDLFSISSQFVAMISDRVFWPRVLVPGNVVAEDEVEQAVRQAALTLAARLGQTTV